MNKFLIWASRQAASRGRLPQFIRLWERLTGRELQPIRVKASRR
ncbi:MAG: hypothetical protein AB7C89_05825 [Intestinibacillus sp.]